MNEDIIIGIGCGIGLAGILAYFSFKAGVHTGKATVANLIHAMQLQHMAKKAGESVDVKDMSNED